MDQLTFNSEANYAAKAAFTMTLYDLIGKKFSKTDTFQGAQIIYGQKNLPDRPGLRGTDCSLTMFYFYKE